MTRDASVRVPRAVLAAALLALGWTILVAWLGAINLRPFGIPLRSSDPVRPAIVALLLWLVCLWWNWRDALTLRPFEREWQAVRAAGSSVAPLLAILLAVATLAVGLARNTLVAGGADSYGYVSQAHLLLRGSLIVHQPEALSLPWPDANWTLAPLGYRPGTSPDVIVPIYPQGLPMLMTLAMTVLGPAGAYVVSPVSGAVLVWLTFLIGRRAGSPLTGLAGAALVATGPVFLFMLTQPMSDVPVAAALAASVVCACARWRGALVLTGLAASLVVAIRPNLAPVAMLPCAVAILDAGTSRERLRSAVAISAGAAPLLIALAVINAVLYGAPWRSGYGDASLLYGWRYWLTNMTDYGRWLAMSETPFLLLAVVPIVWSRAWLAGDRRVRVMLALVIGGVCLSYLFYMPFGSWPYLRFLLPALPCAWVLALVGARAALGRLPTVVRAIAMTLIVATVLIVHVTVAGREYVLDVGKGQADFYSIGSYLQTLPGNAMVISMQHSGSARLYSGRWTLRYDWLPEDWWPRVVAPLQARGYRPYVLLDDNEEAIFRRRFHLASTDRIGQTVAVLGVPARTRLYDPVATGDGAPVMIPERVPRFEFRWNTAAQ